MNPLAASPVGQGALTDALLSEIVRLTGSTELIVRCALTPCHEERAARAVGRAGVEAIKRVARQLAEGEGAE